MWGWSGGGAVLRFFKGKSLDGAHQSPSGAFHPHTNSDSCLGGLVMTPSQTQSLTGRNESHSLASMAGRVKN